MKVRVTITGTLNLDKGDIELLKKASPGEVLDALRYQAEDMEAEIGMPKELKVAKETVKGLRAKVKELLNPAKVETPKEQETEK